MRSPICALLVLAVLSSCGDDDDDQRAAATTTSSTTAAACATNPRPPLAADGSPAQVVATAGDVQLAIVDHGAAVDVVSLFVEVDCDLQAVTLGGTPAALPVGGTVNHGDGLVCANDEFAVLTATSDDGETYQVTTTTYRLDGTELTETDRTAATLEAQGAPDDLSAYYRLDC